MINSWAGYINEIAIKWEPVPGKGNKNILLHICYYKGAIHELPGVTLLIGSYLL